MYVCIYVYMHIYICMCIRVYVYVCVYIYIYVCICMCIYICICLYIACMCSLFHLTLGNEDGGVQLVYENACCLAWGVILTEGNIGVLSVPFLFQRGWECMWVRVCIYARTHTHTAQIGYLDVSPGVGMSYLEGLKNPVGLNLGI